MAHDKHAFHHYTIIKVVRNEDLYQQIGRDVYCDLVDHNKVRSLRVPRFTPFYRFKKVVAEQFGVSVPLQRFWLWARRVNETYRPYRPLTNEEETQHVCKLRKIRTKAGKKELILFLEVLETVPYACTLQWPLQTGEDILLFFKLYEPEKEEIRYVGKLFVKASETPRDILKKLNDMANFAPDEEIKLYEEIRFVPTAVRCDRVKKELTFLDNELQNGDIICYQKANPITTNYCRYPDIPSFLGYSIRSQGLEEAKFKVIVTKDKLKKAEEIVAPLQLQVIAMKDELKEAEANVAALKRRDRCAPAFTCFWSLFGFARGYAWS